LLQYAILTEV